MFLSLYNQEEGWGEELTVKELYQAYEKPIYRYLYGLTTDHHLAEELTQETFYQVVKSFPRFRGDAHVTTWLFQIAHHVHSGWKRERTTDLPLLNVNIIASTDDPQAILEQQEQLRQKRAAWQRLPEKYREVIWLREADELSYEEIATVVCKSVSWVKVNLYRARRALQP